MAARRRLCSVAVWGGAALWGSPVISPRPWRGRDGGPSCAFVDCFQRTARGSLADMDAVVARRFGSFARPVLMVFSRRARKSPGEWSRGPAADESSRAPPHINPQNNLISGI